MALIDMERWVEPGTRRYVQTIRCVGLPGWIVVREADNARLHRRAPETEVERWLIDNGYLRRPVGSRIEPADE
jgi:hypothetical protein